MKRIKLLTITAVLFSVSFMTNTVLAQYGGDGYGQCAFGQACPVAPPPPPEPQPEPPVDPDPPITPPSGEETPDEDPDPTKVVSDVDGDGNNEEAIDTDGNPDNGYEEYYDPDGSSESLVDIETPNGSKFIVDTDGDGRPDVYWDPNKSYSSPVEVLSDQEGVGWFYQDSDGQTRVYYAERFTPESEGTDAPPATTDDRRLTGSGPVSAVFKSQAYEEIGELVVKVPPGVAYSFPYLLLSVVGILIARLIMQTKQELSRVSVVVEKIRREKELVAEKQNFLMLSSHYMRTPMTVIKGNIELLQSLKTLNEQAAGKLQTITASLQSRIENLLGRLDQDKGLAAIQAPQQRESVATRKILLSPKVLMPILAIVLISVSAQFIFIDFRVTKPNIVDILVQTGLGILLVQILVSKIRSHQIHKQNRKDHNDLLEKQRQLDKARADLVNAAAAELRGDVFKLEDELQALAAQGTDISRVRKGSDQLKSIINKFVFAAGLQAGQVTAQKEQFKSSEIIQNSIQNSQDAAQEKNISLAADGSELMLVQNKQLMNIVLSSLVDNAVKFGQEGTQVAVKSEATNDQFVFTVNNSGKEIDQTKVDQLFKPFSRLESAETFDQEGLGFSLYLDRLIMMYLGGQINVLPVPGQGTNATVAVPVLS